jgi:hypothetical protein
MDKKTLIISAPLIISTPISYAHASDTSISVYPPILQVKAGPGANVSAPVSIRNNGKEEVILDILFRPFASESTRIGSVSFVPSNQISKTESEFINKIKILDEDKEIKSINLYPNESKNLHVVFTAPVKPVDYYLSLIFISKPQIKESTSKDTTTTISTGIATNMLISIQNAKQKTSGVITEFEAKKFIINNSPSMKLIVTNTNTTYASVGGTISIYNIFGKKITSIPLKQAYVLAKESRNLTTVLPQKDNNIMWNEKFLFGFYEAKATVTFDNIYTTSAQSTFLCIPLIILAIVCIMLFILLGILFRVINKLNFKNQ